MAIEDLQPIRYAGVDADDIEVHWQHPRHGMEDPVLLVWPMPVRDKWSANLSDGKVWIVCHETLYDDPATGEVEKLSRAVNPNEPIPRCVAMALYDYEGEYGPVDTVSNPYPMEGKEVKLSLPSGQRKIVGADE